MARLRQTVDQGRCKMIVFQEFIFDKIQLHHIEIYPWIFMKLSDIEFAMERRTEEWLRQSDYDMDTAEYMHRGGRQIYAVFMCHLAVEKALKGLYHEKRHEIPPKSHNLIYLLNEIGIKPPQEPGKIIVKLNEASIPTRYPENLAKLQQHYTEFVVSDILVKGKELLLWIKLQL
jgi:HEPN domain-containing protein